MTKQIEFNPTPEQKAAIDHFEGPAVVFAGPGSGKTEVIVRRVVALVTTRGVKADQIFLTTFTNKAADELRVRLAQVLRETLPEAEADRIASKVNVGTIHSMCYRVLREFGFKYEATAKPVMPATEDDQILFLNRFYNEFGLKKFYEDTKEFWKNEGFKDPFSNFITGLTTALNTISEECDDPETVLPQLVSASKDEVMRGCFEVYLKYRAKMKSLNRVDQSMVLNHVGAILREHSETARHVRETWPFILVDEYQDTSPLQDKIFGLIYCPGSNIMAVGDDDQSIYRFRNAEPKLFLTFTERFGVRADHRYVLAENRRATPSLVDFSKKFIEKNKNRKSKDLRAAKDNPSGNSPIYFQSNDKGQAGLAVSWIKELRSSGKIPNFRNAAIITFSVGHFAYDVQSHCHSLGIPYRIESDKAFLKHPTLKGFIDLLDAAQSTEPPTPGKLNSRSKLRKAYDAFGKTGCSKDEIVRDLSYWQHRLAHAERSDNLLKLFYAFIDRYKLIGRETVSETMKALGQFSVLVAKFEEGRRSTAFQPPTTMLDGADAVEEPLSPSDQKALENVKETFPPDWLSRRANRFIRYLSMLNLSNEPEELEDYLLVTTIHKAKGLEFDAVAILGVDSWCFPGDPSPGLRDKVRFELNGHSYKNSDVIEEKRRLLYVAMTRARRSLLLTAGEKQTSPFIAEADLESLGSEQILENLPHIYAPKQKRELEILRLSHGQVTSYLECPKRYLLEHHYDFQGLATPALRLGHALHRAIENAHRWQMEQNQPLDETLLKTIFAQTWPLPKKTKDDFLQYSDYEKTFLNYFTHNNKLQRQVVTVESDLAVVRSSNILTGKIDVLQSQKEKPIIVEIKLNYNRQNLEHAKQQLNHYALAFPDQEVDLKAQFLRGRKFEEEIERRDKNEVKEQVAEVFGRVREQNFKPNPKKDKCSNCRMNKICCEGRELLRPARAA